jgi:hypothetical protein
MSKIVQAVNAMISNKHLIDNVIIGEIEIFFRYREKYIWSVRRETDSGEYLLWYYPGADDVDRLAANDGEDWERVTMVVYKTAEIGTKEARASFAELHSIVKERIYGMDEILEDIISDSEDI